MKWGTKGRWPLSSKGMRGENCPLSETMSGKLSRATMVRTEQLEQTLLTLTKHRHLKLLLWGARALRVGMGHLLFWDPMDSGSAGELVFLSISWACCMGTIYSQIYSTTEIEGVYEKIIWKLVVNAVFFLMMPFPKSKTTNQAVKSLAFWGTNEKGGCWINKTNQWRF